MSARADETGTERLWTATDVARFLRLSRSWVYQASAAGTLPCVRIGAALRFHRAAIEAWLHGERAGKAVQLPGCR
jgi:excisionase family DNA binding protein